MNVSKNRATKAHSFSLSIIPIALLIACVLGAMTILANRATSRTVEQGYERERRQVNQSFSFEADNLLQTLIRDETIGDSFFGQRNRETLEKTLQSFSRRHSLDYIGVFSRIDGIALAESGETDILAHRAASVRLLVENSKMRSVEGSTIGIGREARIVQDGQGLIVFATIPVGRSGVVIATRPISSVAMRRFSTMLAIPNLRLIMGTRNDPNSTPIPSFDGNTRMSVIWDASSEAADMLKELAFYGLIATLLISAVGVYLFRRIRLRTEEILRREAKAHHEASHDVLSGLPNRAVFCENLMETLDEIKKKDQQAAVLLLDLDKFKEINDTYGHAAGDKVLIEFGTRTKELLRQSDIVARLGGDEFAVLLPAIRTQQDVTRLAQAIIDAANLPFMIDGIAMRIGVTIGIALAPDDGNDMATILRCADTALYRAKNDGRNRFALYEHKLNEVERMRKLVDDELRGAIERDELTLVYQPQVHADTGRLASVEALVRWRHPVHGVISPATFISAAEERGLIVALGEWVLRRACKDAARWPGLRVGVNVSATQFRQKDFVESVQRVMSEANIEPERIEVELTEGVLVHDADQAEAAMMQLRAIGVKLALDDFGTGYSSLIYLRRFAFDKIKIDKSFLDSMESSGESAILVHSVVHLGRALGLEVTAEGVETEEQRRFLQAVGCHFLQGYLFSKPVPPEQIDLLIMKTEDLSLSAPKAA